MKQGTEPTGTQHFLDGIKEILALFECDERQNAIDAYERLETWVKRTHLLENGDVLNLFLETEFLIFDHGSTSLSEVKELYRLSSHRAHTTGRDDEVAA